AAGRIVCVSGERHYFDIVHLVGTGAVTGGALQNLRANRCIRALVAKHMRAHRGEMSVSIATDGVGHLDRMSLWMEPEALFTAQRQPHRASGLHRKERGLSLNAHVFLAAKCTAVCH